MKSRNNLLAIALLVALANHAIGEPAAWIGDEAIDIDLLDDKAGNAIMEAKQSLYDARREALQVYIKDRLLNAEAEARNTTTEQLYTDEVLAKVPALTMAWSSLTRAALSARTHAGTTTTP